jgi:6-phosphogluconolactonase
MPKAVFYQSIGPELARYDIDVEGAALTRRDAVTTPGANVQYVWPHPAKTFLYVVSSDGGPAPFRAPNTLPPHFTSIRRPAR